MNNAHIGEQSIKFVKWCKDNYSEDESSKTKIYYVDGTASQTKEIVGQLTWQDLGKSSKQSSDERISSIDIGTSVTSIDSYACFQCHKLQELTLPSIEEATFLIEDNAFVMCYDLTAINNMDAVSSVGYASFNVCTGLTSLDCQNALSVGASSFDGCSNILSANFPSLLHIGDSAFSECTNLTSISCPNVQSIGSMAFWNCSSLSTVILSSMTLDNPTTVATDSFNTETYEYLISVYVPLSCVEYLKQQEEWKQLEDNMVITIIGI